MSLKRLVDKIKRSKTAIFDLLQNPTIYVITKSLGSPKILSKRSRSLIIHTVPNKKITAKEIGSQIKTPASLSTVRRRIKKVESS